MQFFFEFFSLLRKRSFALNDIDRKLKPYLNFKNGFFIEAGANDGITYSNTLYFEKYYNWSGILIEPIPELVKRCRVNRPKCIVEQYALVSSDFKGLVLEVFRMVPPRGSIPVTLKWVRGSTFPLTNPAHPSRIPSTST